MSNDSLFSASSSMREPLASRMRPRNLDEYIGQDHIVGKGRLLRRAIAADQLTSVIFYGPPGSGKTTLARVIANHTKSNFITLNAVLTGVADIRNAIKQAEDYFNLYSRRTILFVDEVHRWNKSQQDALLPWVENGTIILIGATTENPFFEVNKALVSRSRVFQLKALTKQDLEKAASQALNDTERGYGRWKVEFESGALEHLIDTANGDARSLLNALELAVETTPEKWNPNANPPVPALGSTIFISKEAAEESIQKKVVLYDRDGDYHYDIISAFIKSLRGRDPDAAMYWLARMVRAGEDPHFIFRRMLISSCEDTGLADPSAISVVNSCAQAFDRVGMPEGRYFLAHAALYLATAPKSNSSMAFFDALSSVEKEDADVPNHLRDSNRDAEGFGHGAGYLYPHAYRDHWVAQQYLPDALMGRVFYTPSTQGYEKQIRQEVLSRRELQIAALLERRVPDDDSAQTGSRNAVPEFSELKQETQKQAGLSEFGINPISEWWIAEHFKGGELKKGENLTFSPVDNLRESTLDKADKQWRSRLDSNRADVLLSVRDTMISMASLLRYHRSLVWNADDGLLLWEVARKTPEGMTCGVCRSERGKEILEQYGRTLGDLDRPLLLFRPETENQGLLSPVKFKDFLLQFEYKGTVFDRLFFRDPFAFGESVEALAKALAFICVPHQKQKGKIFTDESEAEKEVETKSFYETDTYDGNADENADETSVEPPLADGWCAVISQKIPSGGQHISELIKKQVLTPSSAEPYLSALEKMEQAEKSFFGDVTNPLFSWNCETIAQTFRNAGFAVESAVQTVEEKRRITLTEIRRWFDTKTSAYGTKMLEAVGAFELQKLITLLENASANTIFSWKTETAYFTVRAPKTENKPDN
ncbi:AAA family ATPase [uncultured Treponema sp.]|uniref:AAA family ATPase n=1 Tax=uncultured Treponema sp. TaxID=162155 RepID=UPI002595CC0D|nr:AAA family ATPase [uncultured Treponema sp.]